MIDTKSPESGQYEPLADLIEPFIEFPFAKLPKSVQSRWDSDFPLVWSYEKLPEPMPNRWDSDFPAVWDLLAPTQRRSFAQQHDQQCDPANGLENDYWAKLADAIDDEERQQHEWELSSPQGVPSEIATRNAALNASKRRLQSLEMLWSRPLFTIKDWNDLCNEKLEASLAVPQQADTQPQASNDAPVGKIPEWETLARVKALKIIKRDQAKDLYPSQTNIADEIAKEFRNAKPQIVGASGKPLTGTYIKRHALKGVSSEQGRQLSTNHHRGK